MSGGVQLPHQVLGLFVLSLKLIKQLQLLLSFFEAGQLGLDVELPELRLLLVGLDLGLGAAALGAHFQHVHRGALLHYSR